MLWELTVFAVLVPQLTELGSFFAQFVLALYALIIAERLFHFL